MSRLRRALPRLNYQHLLQLLRAARRGNPVAGEAVEYIAGCADEGDRDAQQMLLEASGNDPQLLERWAAIASGVEDPDDYDMEIDGEAEGTVVDQPLDIPELAGFSATADNEIIAGVEEILAGGPLWDHLKPRLGFRPESQVWSLRDNYGLGLEGIQQR